VLDTLLNTPSRVADIEKKRLIMFYFKELSLYSTLYGHKYKGVNATLRPGGGGLTA